MKVRRDLAPFYRVKVELSGSRIGPGYPSRFLHGDSPSIPGIRLMQLILGFTRLASPERRNTVSDTKNPDAGRSNIEAVDQARRGVEQAESGKVEGVEQIDQARKADPAGVEAVEQEASDGPAGRGLSR